MARVILDASDDGEITDALTLFDYMEKNDARFFSVASTRRLALTGLDWEIVSAADVQRSVRDKNLAEEAAALIREKFDALDGLDSALEHMATAIGPNLAVPECIWESMELVELAPVPYWRLTMDLGKSTDIRIVTREKLQGMVAETGKFIVHIPNAKSGSPIANSLTRAQAWLWFIKRLGLADWATFCKLFGMPIRIGTYAPSATPEEKRILVNMLKNLGTSAWAAISQAVKLDFIESTQRATAPYEALMNHCGREQAILWLGGNLTSDTTGGTGTFAAAALQEAHSGPAPVLIHVQTKAGHGAGKPTKMRIE